MHINLRSFIDTLQQENELHIIDAPVDPYLEIAEIHRRVIEEEGPALLFTNVKGSSFPVVTNLFGSAKRIEHAFGPRPERLIQGIIGQIHSLPPTLSNLWKEREMIKELLRVGLKQVKKAPVFACKQQEVDLSQLPVITSWPQDGGPFITLPLVYTEHPQTGQANLGMYRIQIYNQNTTGMHWQIHKGGGFHYHEAEKKNQALPVHLFLGGPPALIASAIAPIPEGLSELLLASLILGQKLPVSYQKGKPYPYIAEAEWAITGHVLPHIRKEEGPFGDHYGYYSLEHPFPVFHVKEVYHRKNAIYPATIVGKPKQEDFYLGEFLQRLLSPAFPLAMPGVRDLWTYAETGFHSLTGAVVRESYEREVLTHAFRILGEGQLSLTKFLIVTDHPMNLQNFPALLQHVLARFDPAQDLLILGQTSMDTLDYTGRLFNRGSKGVLIGTGYPIRTLPTTYQGPDMAEVRHIAPFCPGCLVLEVTAYEEQPKLAKQLLTQYGELLEDWPWIILVDQISAAKHTATFLWTIFTRFDPAHDIYAHSTTVRHHLKYRLPIIIDARMKPGYPDELEVNPTTKSLVDRRWKEYFPG